MTPLYILSLGKFYSVDHCVCKFTKFFRCQSTSYQSFVFGHIVNVK